MLLKLKPIIMSNLKQTFEPKQQNITTNIGANQQTTLPITTEPSRRIERQTFFISATYIRGRDLKTNQS